MNAGKAASADASALPMLANHCENHSKRLFPMCWGQAFWMALMAVSSLCLAGILLTSGSTEAAAEQAGLRKRFAIKSTAF